MAFFLVVFPNVVNAFGNNTTRSHHFRPSVEARRNVKTITFAPIPLLPITDKSDSFSQCGQDYIVNRLFSSIAQNDVSRRFYYIDLAANDAEEGSNTFILDRRANWSGICIEPNPVYWESLVLKRSCALYGSAVSNTDSQTLMFHFDGALGGLMGAEFNRATDNRKGRPVGTLSLTTILRRENAPRVIDYLSLDVEGAEWNIMRDFPFDSYSFRVLSVERPPPQLRELLARHEYKFIGFPGRSFGEELWFSQKFMEEEAFDTLPTIEELRRGWRQTRHWIC